MHMRMRMHALLVPCDDACLLGDALACLDTPTTNPVPRKHDTAMHYAIVCLLLRQVIHDLAVDGSSLHMRESRLTQCLTESLNGKAITILIAAISPAAINYGDTISTLRFADNAKRLKVKPQKKLDPTAQMIADLKEENDRLRHLIEANTAAVEEEKQGGEVGERARARRMTLQLDMREAMEQKEALEEQVMMPPPTFSLTPLDTPLSDKPP